MPHLSVIVPVYNREKMIEMCLKAIRESVYRDYEIIVIDDCSDDQTPSVAKKYANQVMILPKRSTQAYARNVGMHAAKGEIIVNIDSDVLIRPDTLTKIADYFMKHPDVIAVTGLLSKDNPNKDFFSQYKNLYMNYIFNKLPETVTFLYGSIFAVRREVISLHSIMVEIVDDTAFGQRIASSGKKIAFLKDLEVVHFKKYDFISFVRNDFKIPFIWSNIFLKYKGWKQIGRQGTGFAHSPKEQLLSVTLAPAILLLLFGALFWSSLIPFASVLSLIWFLLNFHFIRFLTKERGFVFGLLSVFITFLDNIVMISGILCGLLVNIIQLIRYPDLNDKRA